MMARMDRSAAWRSALLMGAAVAVIAVILGVALDESFFRSWGWLAGPGVWAACALLVARVLRLPAGWTLLGAALSGLPSLVAVLADVHWAGTPLALILFGLWCGRLASRRGDSGAGAARAVTA
jgi:hypothetical protein